MHELELTLRDVVVVVNYTIPKYHKATEGEPGGWEYEVELFEKDGSVLSWHDELLKDEWDIIHRKVMESEDLW